MFETKMPAVLVLTLPSKPWDFDGRKGVSRKAEFAIFGVGSVIVTVSEEAHNRLLNIAPGTHVTLTTRPVVYEKRLQLEVFGFELTQPAAAGRG